MKAATAIFRVTLSQLLKAKRNWALLAVGFLPALVFGVAQRNMTDGRAFEFFHEPPLAMLLVVVMPIISLVVGAAALGEERSQSTLSFLVLRPIPRVSIIGAKALAAWATSFALVGLAGVVLSGLLGLFNGNWDTLVPLLVLIALNTLGYTALFVPLGHLVERAVLVGLAYVFIYEGGLALAIEALGSLSISRIGLSAYVGLLPESASILEEPLGNVTPGAGGAVLKAAVLGMIAGYVMTIILRRRDLV